MRHESRRLRYSRDFPHTLPVSFPTVLLRANRNGKKLWLEWVRAGSASLNRLEGPAACRD